ncbi:PBECR4 domain-containing protein [Lapidilactobacillus bayanensis]|uniref:PBECR4 domain-containing protein n=1 Tax=Lapidilactobacillus bayanensis TaxID=2485998 RepID=UPI000F76FFE3|nr:PBECR4 domain-containing protein [Lapidilactobacillus bayanensis]
MKYTPPTQLNIFFANKDIYQINSANDIDYLKILNDYKRNFVNNIAVLHTNYKKIETIKISFAVNDLPHLMGWEKINQSSHASSIIKMIESEKMTYSSTRKNQNFYRIKDRLLNYNFLHTIFINEDLNTAIMTSDMKPNKLRLDIVFYSEEDHKHAIILGLRKDMHSSYFIPTTLHVEKIPNQFSNRRRTSIIGTIEWYQKHK